MAHAVLTFLAVDTPGTGSPPSLVAVVMGAALLAVLVGAMVVGRQRQKLRPMLFGLIILVVVSTTWFAAGTAIYTDAQSYTGGPVRWQAAFQIWACNNQLNLRDPHGLFNNTVGKPGLYEQNDQLIHVKGIPATPADASLGAFMTAVSGTITSTELTVPLNETNAFYAQDDGNGPGIQAPEQIQPFLHTTAEGNVATFTNGQQCGSQNAEVQTFVYRFNNADQTYTQTKLTDPASYTISGQRNIPPGDCVIIEFAPHHDRTNKLCPAYGQRDATRCSQFGVPPQKRSQCTAREVKNG